MKRGKFNLGYTKLFSCDMGELIPFGLTEVLPGDSIRMNTQLLLRASPMLAPVYHSVQVRIHHWFVPHRLVWDSFQDFITGGPAGTSTPAFPTITKGAADLAIGSLFDYYGVYLPIASGNTQTFSALPIRGYQLIWSEWYRDQDLETAAAISKGDGSDGTTNIALRNCAWEKDYFTSARPWEQKGPTVTVPIGVRAPISGLGVLPAAVSAGATTVKDSTTTAAGVSYPRDSSSATNTLHMRMTGSGVASDLPDVYADLTSASSVTITALRQAAALQRFEENAARYGSRYTEYLRRLGVKSSDARIQRPEFLGGGRQTIQWSEVLQTAADGTNPVGTLRGHGIAHSRSNSFRRFFEEHGYIHTFLSVRPKTIYQNGTQRTWNRRVKEDFYQPELVGIGQQKVLNKEVYADLAAGTASNQQDGTFGYQDRYDEYRRHESEVSGEFRSTLLNFWHMARDFGAVQPNLNASFVQCVPTERIFAVPSQDNLYVYARHNIRARRLVPQSGRSYLF